MTSRGGPRVGTRSKVLPTYHPGRWLAAAALLVLLAQLAHALLTNARFDWGTVHEYLFAAPILNGLVVTLRLTAISMIMGIVLGVLLALMRLSSNPLLSSVSVAYIWFFRGTPLLVQLIFWFNLSALYPKLSLGVPFGHEFVTLDTNTLIAAEVAALLGLGLNESAYMSEIVRSGIVAIDRGQTDAALALGMSKSRTMMKVVLPQAMKVIIPPTGNQVISLLKATSLVSVIAIADLLFSAEAIYARNYRPIPLLIVASLWYLVVTTVLMIGQRYIERYYGKADISTRSSDGN